MEKQCSCQELIRKMGLKDEHELQSYFIRRIEIFVNKHGKKIIGWDEILEGGLAPNATVMSWRGIEGGKAVAKMGHDVIMTPTDYCYLDYLQSKGQDEGLAIGGFLPLEKVYSYDPVPSDLDVDDRKYILGTQGNVWTEYMDSPARVWYQVLPRMTALAEVAWSKSKQKISTIISTAWMTTIPIGKPRASMQPINEMSCITRSSPMRGRAFNSISGPKAKTKK